MLSPAEPGVGARRYAHGDAPPPRAFRPARISFDDSLYHAPHKFGGKEVDHVTMLNVHSRIELRSAHSVRIVAHAPGVIA